MKEVKLLGIDKKRGWMKRHKDLEIDGAMLQRLTNVVVSNRYAPKATKAKLMEVQKYYGGNGVSYDTRWGDFLNFLEDMGERLEGTSLDRIDPSGNYCKDNCRWATREQQAYNQNLRATNTSGKTGVYACKRNKVPTWIAFIEVEGKRKHLGSFKSFELAVKIREAAGLKYYGNLKGH